MKSDFEVIVKKLPKADVRIYPVSDLHVGDAGFNEDAFIQFVNHVQESSDEYVILAGDLMNNAIRTSVSNVFAETMRPSEQKRWIAERLEPIRDKILCAVPGNHERRSLKDADDEPLYDIMCKLDLEDIYRPNMAFLEIELGDTHAQYRIGVTHGSSGASKTGGAVNRNEAFGHIIEGLDALITGHTHKGAITRPQKMVVNPVTKRVEMRDFVVMTTVAWNGHSDYAIQKQLNPASSQLPCLYLKANASHKAKSLGVVW